MVHYAAWCWAGRLSAREDPPAEVVYGQPAREDRPAAQAFQQGPVGDQVLKGTPLDEVREQRVTRGRRSLHLIGSEVREAKRIAKDQEHDTDLRCGWYPLAEAGNHRAACLAGIKDKTGRTWGKSGRRSPDLPTREEFYVAAPHVGPEKRRPGFWTMWARAG
ncbi:hypothetical protein [Nonomuraea turcica]|uniref:hypothetical protein n=1 Tax=Nonomuraea sp. G32 TaxID=3067274 RepID=UPI00273AD44C|nr:hypothetical protein [Nonomuraea sp. G32]MDP4510316.1 hypothetical protein [Nonomuraea sp. G32]